jgi:hypothetical protein
MDIQRGLYVRWMISLVLFLVLLAIPVLLSIWAPVSVFAAR